MMARNYRRRNYFINQELVKAGTSDTSSDNPRRVEVVIPPSRIEEEQAKDSDD